MEWDKLDAFTRCSNISCADYHEIRLKMMEAEQIPTQVDQLSSEQMKEKLEWLAELEHIRWCRYHYLANWRQGIPENGKAKDMETRIHKDLVPYHRLELDSAGQETEKEKDRENIRLLLSI